MLYHNLTCLAPHAEAQENFEAALELLTNAPADRKWRCQAFLLIMCRERHRQGEAQLLDDAAGTRVGAWVLEAGTGVGKEVGYSGRSWDICELTTALFRW